MSRVKRGVIALKKRNKVIKAVKGFRGARGRTYRAANEALLHSLIYAFRDRRVRKRDFRSLWITRINAAARANGISYSQLMAGLKAAGSVFDRKVLADIAVRDSAAFTAIVTSARAALDKAKTATR